MWKARSISLELLGNAAICDALKFSTVFASRFIFAALSCWMSISFLKNHHCVCHIVEIGVQYPIIAEFQISCKEIPIKSIWLLLKMCLILRKRHLRRYSDLFRQLFPGMETKPIFISQDYSSTVEFLLWRQPILHV